MSKNQQGTLGVWDGWSLGTGTMMGASIFVVSGTTFPETGGASIYPRKVISGTLGEMLSFASGWVLFGGQGIGSSMVAITRAEYLNWTLQWFGISNPVPVKIIAFGLIIFYAVLNMNSITGGRIFQLATTFVIAGIMLLYCILGFGYVDTANYADFMPNGVSSLFTASAMALMSYGAWSVIPAMGRAFKNPTRDIPMSMLLSLVT